MTKTNDIRILELKKQIKNKKDELGVSKRFSPVTNCVLDLYGNTYNLNTLNAESLTALLININMTRLSANDLDLGDVVLSGYKLSEWIADIKGKLDILNRKVEEQKLKKLEDKLTKLLSEDKKVELEIDEIESLLK